MTSLVSPFLVSRKRRSATRGAARAVPAWIAMIAVAGSLAGCAGTRNSRGAADTPPGGGSPAPAGEVHAPPSSWPYPESPALAEGAEVHKLLKQVTFESGSATLNSEARGALGQAVDLLRQNTAWSALVVGFADARGEASRAARLSEQRAAAVSGFLASQGIDKSRVTVQAMGSAHAQAGPYEANQAEQDRRCELWAFTPRR